MGKVADPAGPARTTDGPAGEALELHEPSRNSRRALVPDQTAGADPHSHGFDRSRVPHARRVSREIPSPTGGSPAGAILLPVCRILPAERAKFDAPSDCRSDLLSCPRPTGDQGPGTT